jgi:hypothetical protein
MGHEGRPDPPESSPAVCELWQSVLSYDMPLDKLPVSESLHKKKEAAVPASQPTTGGVATILRGALGVSCYLCAYKRTEAPYDHQPLPAGSPAGAHDDLGGCWKCSVWACSAHGTRYGKFECAICTPATATTNALVATPVAGAAAARAYGIGSRGSRTFRRLVAGAVRSVVDASRQPQAVDALVLAAPERGTPNLVTNLADEIRQRESAPSDGLVPAVQASRDGQTWGVMSLDVIGGAVREQFAGVPLAEPSVPAEAYDLAGPVDRAEPDDPAVRIVTGALLLGYALADEVTTARVRRDDGPPAWENITSLPPPWQVSYPILLDPVLWMLGTALPGG